MSLIADILTGQKPRHFYIAILKIKDLGFPLDRIIKNQLPLNRDIKQPSKLF